METRSGASPLGRRISAVVIQEVERLGCCGVVLASPPGPANELLRTWLGPMVTVRAPDPGGVSDVAGALVANGASGRAVERLAWRAVAEALGEAEGLLCVGDTNKTQLLLDPGPLPARVLPLGDVWASQIHAMTGRWALPPALVHASPDQVVLWEEALRAYLLQGTPPTSAFAPLGPQAEALRRALDAAEGARRGLLVPKLEAWTVGADLAR